MSKEETEGDFGGLFANPGPNVFSEFFNGNQPGGVPQVKRTLPGLDQLQFGPVDAEKPSWHPSRSHVNDAGFDLYVTERTVLRPGEFKDLPTNVWVALPDEYWGLVTGRSSALRKHGLLVHSGVVDAGYRGELFAGAFNLSGNQVVVEAGWRLAQFLPLGRYTGDVVWNEGEPPPGTRGSDGFGSTGQ
ncbi:dUTPase [Gordonia phage Sapo]|nr:dUTPase [Gordonia phage Sapo]